MKIKFISAPNNTPKLFCTVVLSAFLVACGGGSGDGTGDGSTAGTLDSGDNGLTDLDLGGDDSGTETDTSAGIIDPLIVDSDGNGIPDDNEGLPCKGLGGSDPGSNNATWADNCFLQADINTDTAELDRSPFYNSTSIDAFADGFFGPNTDTAVRAFQESEELIVDGIVGPATWGRMQELVETADASTLVLGDSDLIYDAYGVAPVAADSLINCEQQTNFLGRFNTDASAVDKYEGWELSKTPGMNDPGSFSVATPQ